MSLQAKPSSAASTWWSVANSATAAAKSSSQAVQKDDVDPDLQEWQVSPTTHIFLLHVRYNSSLVLLLFVVPFTNIQPVRFVVNDRELFTAGWFGVREKY